MSEFRKWLNRQDEGTIKRLAERTKRSHAQISRIADGHRGASLPVALTLSEITGLPPSAFAKKVTTPQEKTPARSTAKRGRG